MRKEILVPDYLGTLNNKNLPLFDKSLMTLELLYQTILSFQGIRFYSIFRSNHKRVIGKLIENARA